VGIHSKSRCGQAGDLPLGATATSSSLLLVASSSCDSIWDLGLGQLHDDWDFSADKSGSCTMSLVWLSSRKQQTQPRAARHSTPTMTKIA